MTVVVAGTRRFFGSTRFGSTRVKHLNQVNSVRVLLIRVNRWLGPVSAKVRVLFRARFYRFEFRSNVVKRSSQVNCGQNQSTRDTVTFKERGFYYIGYIFYSSCEPIL
ncbi:hypothetical protein HanIR_Chr04g0189131 [Helianthus annuus]|nr:hypothetical protein HanIR_Chr04g0189131 [Helianthus annuus]